LVSIHPIVLKKIFKDFQLFNQSEDMAAIFNIRQGQRTHFWKRSIQRVSHQSLVQFDLLRRSKSEKLTDDRWLDTKWWEKLIWTVGPGELKTFLRTIKWTLLPSLSTIGHVVLEKRLTCKSLQTMRRDGHQVMIIPLITLKGLIFIQAHPYQYMKNTTQTKVCRPARCMSELFSQLSI
jgi:hypothetical protein